MDQIVKSASPGQRSRQEQVWVDARHDPPDYLQSVRRMLGLRGFDTESLEALAPRFDLLAFGEAMSRKCLLAADADARLCGSCSPIRSIRRCTPGR